MQQELTSLLDQALKALRALPLNAFDKDIDKIDAADFVDNSAAFVEAMDKARKVLAKFDSNRQALRSLYIRSEELVIERSRELNSICMTMRRTQKPHWLCKDARGDLWEFISYPWVDEVGQRILVNIRVPGDPTSIITADAMLLDPEDQKCFCAVAGRDFYLRPDYYTARAARLLECPAFVRKP
jgi:hypothetical protein